MEACDWRTKLSKDVREKIVKKIIHVLRRHTPLSEEPLSQLEKIHKVAVNFEEKVYMLAGDEKEYMKRIMVKLMAAEGSHPNVVLTSSASKPSYFCQKDSNPVGNQGQSIATKSKDQSQVCEVPEHHTLLDFRSNIASAGVSANLASARTAVSASPQVLLPISSESSYLPISASSSSGKVKQETQNLPYKIPNPHISNQVKQEYVDPYQNHQPQNLHICKQVKQELIAKSSITQQKIVHQNQQKLLKHAQQQTHPQSVIQAPLVRSSEVHLASNSGHPQNQIYSLKQTSQYVINNHPQTVNGQTNPQETPTPDHVLVQSQKQPKLMARSLTATNTQKNQLNAQPNCPHDWEQQHHGLPLEKESNGQNVISSSQNHEENRRRNISVLHGSSQLPDSLLSSSGKCPSVVKMQGETQQTDLALLSIQVQKSQAGSLGRELNSESQPEKMQLSSIPDSSLEQRISNTDNLQEEVYQKIQVLKSKYLAKLQDIEQRVTSYFRKLNSDSQHPDRGNVKKLKTMKYVHSFANYYILNLNVAKSKIKPGCEEKLGSLENKIISFIHTFGLQKPADVQQHGKLSSDVHCMPQPVKLHHSQTSQVQTCQNEKKLQSQSENVQCFGTKMQDTHLTNLVNGSLFEPPVLQHDGMHLQQNLTKQDSEDANTLNVLPGSLKIPQSSQPANDRLPQNPALGPPSHVILLPSSLSSLQSTNLKQNEEQPDVRTENPNQELTRHKLQEQLVHSKQKQHHQPLNLQSGNLVASLFPKNKNPSYLQAPQYSSVSEKKNLVMPPIQAKSPFGINSPEIRVSSLAPVASPSIPGAFEKPMSETSLLSNAPDIAGPQANIASEAPSLSLVSTSVISASPLLEQSHNDAPQSIDGLNVPEQPIQRLIKVVNSMSCDALNSSALDIGSVVGMTDRIAEQAMVHESGAAIQDLAEMTKFHMHERYFTWQEKNVGTKRRRQRSMPVSYGTSETGSINDSFSRMKSDRSDMENLDFDSPTISYIKKRRLEVNHILLQEITAINRQLINTVLDTVPAEAPSPILDGEGTIVRCSFVAVAIVVNSEQILAPTLPIQPLLLLVPAKYPSCSPVFLDKSKVEVSSGSDNLDDLSAEVKSKLNRSLRNLTEPLSLGEIARTWDMCARAVISEYAEQNGGGSFSSKYGTWEDCLSAAAA